MSPPRRTCASAIAYRRRHVTATCAVAVAPLIALVLLVRVHALLMMPGPSPRPEEYSCFVRCGSSSRRCCCSFPGDRRRPGRTGIVTGVVRDSSGGAIPGATVRIVNEATRGASTPSATGRARTDADGARARPLPRRGGARRLRDRRCGRSSLERRADGVARRDADARAAYRRRGRHRPARRGSGAGGADSGVGRRAATSSPTPAPST